ncbi:MAG: RidA family protein [Steroidobacteraceae bacterium]
MQVIQRIPFSFDWDREMPLSQIVRAGDTLYLAGQVSLDDAGNVVGENDLEAQARQVFRNMQRVLASAGAQLSDIVRLTSYFTMDLSLDASRRYWAVRTEFFGDHRPASTGLQVAGLLYPSLLLEVDAIAVVRS